ncbi:MAG: DUF4091 domain-containing protein [bacterium]|nr:DUF4091 domain-containing protein [bacterium]
MMLRTILIARPIVWTALAACATCVAAEVEVPLTVAPEVAELFTLVDNAGFEDGDRLPAWWSRHPSKNNDRNLHERDTETFRTGAASAHIRWLDPIAGENKAPLQWSKYRLPVKEGIDLIVTGYAKTKDVDSCHAGFNFYDAANEYLGHGKVPGPKNAVDWTPFSGIVHVPDTAASMGFVLYSVQGGDTWYDDVAVLGIPRADAVRATPNLDGRLDDACWDDARAVTAFVRQDGAALARSRTAAWIAYDDTNLYAAFRCATPDGAALRADTVEHDGDVWLDDSVGLLLSPSRSSDALYRIAVNSKGVVYDARGDETSWDSNAIARTARQDGAWTVEIAVPLGSLGLGLDTASEWSVNLVRNDCSAASEVSVWSLGGLDNVRRFGAVSMTPDLTRYARETVLARVTELNARFQNTENQVADADLSADVRTASGRFAAEGRAALAELKAHVQAGSGWTVPQAREALARAERLCDEAHSAVIQAYYATTARDDGGFSVRLASSLAKFPRTEPVIGGTIVTSITLEAARDEAESFQLVVLPHGRDLTGVEVTTEPLRCGAASIPIEWHPVAYVETGTPRGYTPPYVGWWPDVLMPPAPVDVKAGCRQPLWFRVEVPADAPAGNYAGSVSVRHSGTEVVVPVTLRVRPFRLPRPGTLPTAFGLYARALSEWYHGTTNYQKTLRIDDFARWCEFLGHYRLTPKNIANEYCVTKEVEGEKKLDLGTLKQTLAPLAPRYYPPYSFCVYRLPCPADVRNGTTTQDPAVWVRSLQARATEYQRLGLPSAAYVYGIDEPSPAAYPFVRNVYTLVRESTPEFPIMQTVNHSPPEELAGLVDIWCPLSSRAPDPFYAARREAGDTLWTYVCCGPKPPHANFFIDQPAIDHRMVFWQARQLGATGVLYWCVCWWQGIPGPSGDAPHFPEVPMVLRDNAGTLTSLGVNGDGILVWPGPDMTPYPSTRLENVRDGIEDYEYLALLARSLQRVRALPEGKRPSDEVLHEGEALAKVPESISQSMTEFAKDPNVLLERRKAVGDMIEVLAGY